MAMRGGLSAGGSGPRVGGIGSQRNNVGGFGNTPNVVGGGPSFRGTGMGVPVGKEVFDKIGLIASLVFGVIGAFISRMIYGMLVGSLYRPVVILVTIGVFFLIIGVGNILFRIVRGMYSPSFSAGKAFALFAASFAIILILSFVFELIYELGGGFKTSDAGSYIIVIDDSGSMDSSDPSNERYAAIETILQDKANDFPYAVYRFSDETECIREMLPKSQKTEYGDIDIGGGTSIKGALTKVLSDYETGTLKNANNPKVLLLSDGCATDIGLFSSIDSVLKDYGKNGISISTVGLGSGVDEGLMRQIANTTGGVYINVTDVSNLANTMTTAIESYYKRDLLTYRIVFGSNILYVIERILFMGIIGALIGSVLVVVGNGKKQEYGIAIAILKGVVAAVILEIFINSIGVNERIVDYIYFVIVAVVAPWIFVRDPVSRGKIHPNPVEVDNGVTPIDPSKGFGQNEKQKKKQGAKKWGV